MALSIALAFSQIADNGFEMWEIELLSNPNRIYNPPLTWNITSETLKKDGVKHGRKKAPITQKLEATSPNTTCSTCFLTPQGQDSTWDTL